MATKTSGEFEQEFIQTAKAKTGRSLEEWLPVVKAAGLSKQMEITNWLKQEHQLNHLQASLLAGLYLNGGKPVYQNEANLLDNQFAKAANMRPLYEALTQKITALFPDVQIIPKKTYISYTAAREFAAINIKPKEIRLGMDLGDTSFTETLLPAKLSGPMPRISHMAIITDIQQVGPWVVDCLQLSYNRTHKK
jgi:predicted transport protein